MTKEGPVDLVHQGERQTEVATLVYRSLADLDWRTCEAYFVQAGDLTAGLLSVWDERAEVLSRPLPEAALTSFTALRYEMWNPATAPWLHAQLTVHADGACQFFFNYERRFDLNRRPLDRVSLTADPRPADAELVADLGRFPRTPENIPAWYPSAE